MLKLCFVIPRTYYLFNPDTKNSEDKVGGAQKQTYLLSTELAKDPDFDVSFCMADFGQAKFEIRKNVKLWNAFNFKDPLIKRTWRLLKTLKNINADTYIFRSPDVGVAVAVFYLKAILKKKILYMIAGDMETTQERLSRYTGRLTSLSMNYVYKKADTLTAQTAQQALQFSLARKRNPDAIIKNIYPPGDSPVDFSQKKEILWVGRLDKIKNPDLFLKLAQKFPYERFVMIAPVVRDAVDFGKKLQHYAKTIPNLILVEYVDPSKMSAFYMKSKLYVLTSDFEGFSNTMAEAMQSQCAVLSYNVNPDNILNDYNCGICADGDVNRFFEAFENLNSNLDEALNLGKNAADYIRNHHGMEENTILFKNCLL